MTLNAKVAIITGGARGLGFAIAQAFVAQGARVALWDVSEEGLAAARARLEVPPDQVLALRVDVTRAAAVREGMDTVEATLGPIDILINNAGITRDAMLHKMEDAQFDAVIDVNLKGVFLCGREAATRMRARGRGVIVNTASVVGLYGNVGQTNYAASKAGVIAMTRTWAKELGRKGIRVNAIAPGYIATEMINTVPENVLESIRTRTAMGRLGQPQEIAAAAAFLAGDSASFINGHVLSVDGGLTL